jgi:hypothetical protein
MGRGEETEAREATTLEEGRSDVHVACSALLTPQEVLSVTNRKESFLTFYHKALLHSCPATIVVAVMRTLHVSAFLSLTTERQGINWLEFLFLFNT